MKRKSGQTILGGLVLPLILGACVQIVGIEDPKDIETKGESSSSGNGSSSSSSGSSTGDPSSPWIGWRMPNPASAALPNPSDYELDAAPGVIYDRVSGLFWEQSIETQAYSFDEAIAHCDSLTVGGYSDWRLPWRIELVSLIDYTRTNPAIDSIFPNTPSVEFWTASTYVDVPEYAWAVNFGEGDTHTYTKTTSFLVRCVR